MRAWRLVGAALTFVAVAGSSCAPAQPAASSPRDSAARDSAGAAPPSSPKRITIAMLGELPAFWDDINEAGGTVPGTGQFEGLASSGLVVQDDRGALQPQLAEAVPTTENGLWKVFPDGRMEITHRIRAGATWHDGQPFTADDLLFTAEMGRDPDVRVLGNPAYDAIESIEAPDPRTVVIKWKRPYIAADRMFGLGTSMYAQPLPKHVLEPPFRQNKSSLTESPYWTSEFVGNGAFKLREWVAGSHVLLDAFPGYVLGRPKIDQVEVRFIPDPSTLLANVLAGAVDLTFSRAVSTEQAVAAREQWHAGTIVPYFSGWTMMYPQLRAPTPAALADPQFRRAIVQAIDRQQLADTLTAGLAPVADSIVAPTDPEYRSIEASIVRYRYDPNRAAQLFESMGFTKGQDGFQDSTGQRLSVEIRTTTNDANQKATFAIADFFQRVGLGAEPTVIPVQRLQDRVYRTTYAGLELVNQPNAADGFENLLYSGAAPLPERDYRAPGSNKNRGSYINPDYDALMDRYRVTIPLPERMEVMGQLIRLQTDLQLVMGLFFTADAIMMANRLQDVPPASTWNVQLWDVKQ